MPGALRRLFAVPPLLASCSALAQHPPKSAARGDAAAAVATIEGPLRRTNLLRRVSMDDRAESADDVAAACAATIEDYEAVAEAYAGGNMGHDVTQNIESLLSALPLPDGRALDVLDVGCASGRDLVAFTDRGHRAVGLDGALTFVHLARKQSGCEVWHQDLLSLDLPEGRFDGVFANACLFHVPCAALPGTLRALFRTLRPGGALFVSNAHGFGEDREGWTSGRTDGTLSYVTWLSEKTWVKIAEDAGFHLLDLYYRPPNKPPNQQPFLATLWRRPP